MSKGEFLILESYGGGKVYRAKCLTCGWVSGKSTTRGALLKLSGPTLAHHRDKHGGDK